MRSNRARFPSHVYDFAVDENRHNLDSPSSLHDAWMTSISIKENRQEKRPFNPKPTVEVVLLGPMHDREITLEYTDVEEYRIEGIEDKVNFSDTYHGDILCHEVRVNEQQFVIHEIKFASASRIVIACASFVCTEKELNK